MTTRTQKPHLYQHPYKPAPQHDATARPWLRTLFVLLACLAAYGFVADDSAAPAARKECRHAAN